MKISEAWYRWRNKRNIAGEQITLTFVIIVTLQAIFSGTVEFFTGKFWSWLWQRGKK